MKVRTSAKLFFGFPPAIDQAAYDQRHEKYSDQMERPQLKIDHVEFRRQQQQYHSGGNRCADRDKSLLPAKLAEQLIRDKTKKECEQQGSGQCPRHTEQILEAQRANGDRDPDQNLEEKIF